MALCARIVKDEAGATQYRNTAATLKQKIFNIYWSKDKQALVHSRVKGVPTDNVTRYSNMFGIFFDYFSEKQKQQVKQHVLLNDKIQKITTPYMRFYELEALCAMGEQDYVLKEMKAYWGGMLKLGATSFWEEYDPTKKGAEHLAMYGREFGKSLCHAWGASPIYLLGKYYLGVKPTAPGYSEYLVEPKLGGLEWMEGKVPTPSGTIDLYVNESEVRVKSNSGNGILRIESKTKPLSGSEPVTHKGGNNYEIAIKPGKAYVVKYQAVIK
jgi:hypothetical protein